MKYQKAVCAVLVFAVCLGYSQADKQIQPKVEQRIEDGVTAEVTAQNATALNETKDASGFLLRGSFTSYGHLNLGYVGIYDKLLFSKVYYASDGELLLRVYSPYYKLTAIRIQNYYYGGYSSSVSVIDGGIGYQYVVIRMRSTLYTTPFQYWIRLYGR